MKTLTSKLLVLSALLILYSANSWAVMLNVAGGQLMGASNINVNGSYFDVEFLDGTCAEVFGECIYGSNDNFTFKTGADAEFASQALMDQVFLDTAEGYFDTTPGLTNGIHDPFYRGLILTPWVVQSNDTIGVKVFRNYDNTTYSFDDDIYLYYYGVNLDTYEIYPHNSETVDQRVWAKWSVSAVSEPPSFLLFAISLAMLSFYRRKVRAI